MSGNRWTRGWLPLLGAAGFLWCSAPQTETVWVHPEKGGSDLYREREVCHGQAAALSERGGSPYVSAVDGSVRFYECMQERGWHREERVVVEPE